MLLTSVSPSIVAADGGYALDLVGEFPLGVALHVHVGETGSDEDPKAFSGVQGQGDVIYAKTATRIRVYTRATGFEVNSGPLSIYVRAVDGSELPAFLLNCLEVAQPSQALGTFAFRQIFPPRWATGPRSMSQLAAPIVAPHLPPMEALEGALLHFVADDWVDGEPLASRVGLYEADAFVATLSDTIFPADALSASFRKSLTLGMGLLHTTTQVPLLLPPNGEARTYELIARADVGTGVFLSIFVPDGLYFILGPGGLTAEEDPVAIELYNELTPGGATSFDIQSTASDAGATGPAMRYWTLVVDFTGTRPRLAIYDGARRLLEKEFDFDFTNWAVEGSFHQFDLGATASDPNPFMELMISEGALTYEQVLERTRNFRACQPDALSEGYLFLPPMEVIP